MYTIINHRDCFSKIEHIRLWSELLDDLTAKQRDHFDADRSMAIQALRKKIVVMKRAVRAYLRKEREAEPVHIVQSDFDSCIYLMPLPRTITDAETAEDWFMQNEYEPSPRSAYDCTGREFTNWYRIIERNGRFYVYHAIGLDV